MKTIHSGKGNRERPWRDGGAKKKGIRKWKDSVPHAIDEYELHEPLACLSFEFFDPFPADSLSSIDSKLHEKNIRFSIKSRGKTSVARFSKFSKYTITCAETAVGSVRSAIAESGGHVQK